MKHIELLDYIVSDCKEFHPSLFICFVKENFMRNVFDLEAVSSSQ